MLYAAAVACVDAMTEDEFASGRTFPAIDRIRDVSHLVAVRVGHGGFAVSTWESFGPKSKQRGRRTNPHQLQTSPRTKREER